MPLSVRQIPSLIPRWRISSSSRVGVSKASAFRYVSWTVCSPYAQPTATELFQSPLYGSGTVSAACHFLSSALAWRHTSSNSVTRNYCCRAREVTLSFMDTLIALTYLLTYLLHSTALSATLKTDYFANNWPPGDCLQRLWFDILDSALYMLLWIMNKWTNSHSMLVTENSVYKMYQLN